MLNQYLKIYKKPIDCASVYYFHYFFCSPRTFQKSSWTKPQKKDKETISTATNSKASSLKKQCQSFLQIMANACPIFSILTKTCAQQNCLCTYRISLSSAMPCRLGVSHVQVRGFQFQILSMAHKALFCFKYASAIFFCIITKSF